MAVCRSASIGPSLLALLVGLATLTAEGQRPAELPLVAVEATVVPEPDSIVVRPDRFFLYGADSGADDGSSDLLRIDSASAEVTPLGEIHFIVNDIAATPDGSLFGITDVHLIKINPQTGRGTVVGGHGIAEFVNALVSDPSGQLYAATRVEGPFGELESRLWRIDRTTGSAQVVGSYGIGLASSGDLIFTFDGTLYGTATAGGTDFLVRIAPATGRAQIVASLGVHEVFGLALGVNGRLIAAVDGDRGHTPRLASINPTTGELTLNATIAGANGMFGLSPSRMLRAPVEGPLRITGRENPDCANAASGTWTFCQHQTDFHRPGGIAEPASDETLAWDVNLLNNADAGAQVYPVAPGKVVRYGGTCWPCPGFGGLLLEHTEGDGTRWWTGYVHLTDIPPFQLGEFVGADESIGRIGGTGADNEHLHFSLYGGANTVGGLLTRDTLFFNRQVTAQGPPVFLNDGRFAVRVDWATSQGTSGFGQGVTITADTAYFWFFQPTNVELVVKVLRGCPVNGRYWFFAGGLTNVGATITVEDTATGATVTYRNPLGTPFAPIQDTNAFATCP